MTSAKVVSEPLTIVSDWLISFSGQISHMGVHMGRSFRSTRLALWGGVEWLFVFNNFEFDNGLMIADLAPHPLTMAYSCRM